MSAEPPRTLPAWAYRSPEFFQAERREIFTRDWLVIGHVSQVQEPGDYVSMTIAGEPIAVVRGADGELRAFSNVCRHRAARVLDGAGNCGKAMRCPYHGWTYGLDGRLLAIPEKTGFTGFDKDANGLWPLSVGVAAGFVFASLNPEPEPLSEYLGPFERWMAPYRPERLVRSGENTAVLPASTGRTRSTTTSRATTSPSATRACCGCSTTSATWSRPATRGCRSRAARCVTRSPRTCRSGSTSA